MSDFEKFNDPKVTSAMQAVYDRIRELGAPPGLVAQADRVAARIRNEQDEEGLSDA